ncbi:hypothetical protein JW868_01230 [Candidatus Woesearchaeota archaeon]|nr:hypothetical protein [Candidatus Woesearchaeota archaeon]
MESNTPMNLICPHCGEPVDTELDAAKGCQDCIDKWLDEMQVDHDV